VTAPAAILDVDGTLVDTNYQHALAWYRAFRAQGETLPLHRIHRQIGMGGDQLVAALAGEDFDRAHGDAVRAAEEEHFQAMIGEVAPLPSARDLLVALHERGHAIVLSSSAKEHDVERYLDLLDARDLVRAWTTSADVEQTKPAPDLVEVALEQAGGGPAVMVGDSTWDCEAAARAGIASLGVLTGGFSEQELRDAGAADVFMDLPAVLAALDDSPLRSV
jgi:HAD superfamily hydrolase (TIGR01509 family)